VRRTVRRQSRKKSTAFLAGLTGLTVTLAFTAVHALPAEAEGPSMPGQSPSATCAYTNCGGLLNYPSADDTAATAVNTPVAVDVLANDCHSTLPGQSVTLVASVPVSEAIYYSGIGDVPPGDPLAVGTVQVVGTQLLFTPKPGFQDTAVFYYDWSETGPEINPSNGQTFTTTRGSYHHTTVTITVGAGGPGQGLPPLPLLIAHGITGSAAGETQLRDHAKGLVPGLRPTEYIHLDETGGITSVWKNADDLIQDATTEIASVSASNGIPSVGDPKKVNVIAHSKGGLDARLAISEAPHLFNSLGMLSTPNGGSYLADYLCALQGLPLVGGVIQGGVDAVAGNFGPCKTDANGLYDLQTWYVRNVINDVARDQPQVSYVNLGSDCTSPIPGLTSALCNVASVAGLCTTGGDELVCLKSAYYLTYIHHIFYGPLSDAFWPEIRGGFWQGALAPMYGYTHTDMNSKPCPVSRILDWMYAPNYLDKTSFEYSSCLAPSRSSAVSTNAVSSAAPAGNVPSPPLTQQLITAGGADPAHPYTTTLNPEGADTMGATVFLPLGVTSTITVTNSAGQLDPRAVVTQDADDSLGAQVVSVALNGLQGSTRNLTISVDGSSAVGILTQVSSSVALTATATPSTTTGGGNTALTATLAGLTNAQAQATSVTASFNNASGTRVSVPLQYSGSTHQYTGAITLPLGAAQPVDFTATGTNFSRFARTGAVLPTGTAQVGTVHNDSLVDTDGDGIADTLQLSIPVTTAQAGNYHLTVDLAVAGNTVVSGTGSAPLGAGGGDIVVTIPLEGLLAGNAPSGSFQVVRGTLTEGTDGRSLIARVTSMGTTASYNLDSYAPTAPVLSNLNGTGADTNQDGLLDTVHVTATASVPTAGQYTLAGTFIAPDGSVLQSVNRTLTLAAGRNLVGLDLDGSLIGATGSGVYQLSGVTLTAVANAYLQASASPIPLGPFSAYQWIGSPPSVATLNELWDQAHEAGAIYTNGLYVSNHVKLTQAASAATSGDVNGEKQALDVFINHLDGKIDPVWQQRILTYATTLRAGL